MNLLRQPLRELDQLLDTERRFELSDLQYDLDALLRFREERDFFIREWARSKFQHYADTLGQFQTRDTLSRLSPLRGLEGSKCKTSATTGSRFEFRSWRKFKIMRAKNNVIQSEFAVPVLPSVLRLVPDPQQMDISLVYRNSTWREPLASSGARRARTYWFRYHPQLEGPKMCQRLVHELESTRYTEFGVVVSSWSTMQSYLDSGRSRRLARLLYTTCETVDKDAAQQLVERGIVDYVCDNMRCWDGGASFFQCAHGTYHTYDWLCDMQEVDGQLSCTDYFNPVFPFIDYLNGDRCHIGKDWKQCECGRWYRRFEFFGKRPSFTLNMSDRTLTSIQISDAVDGIHALIQAICDEEKIEIRSAQHPAVMAAKCGPYLESMLGPHCVFQQGDFYRVGDRQKFQAVVLRKEMRRG